MLRPIHLDPLPCAPSCSYARAPLTSLAHRQRQSRRQQVSNVIAGSSSLAPSASTASDVAVHVKNLRVELGPPGGQRPVLRGVDLELKKGTLHMLLGPNGCGKSTLLKVLGGLIAPGSGDVTVQQPSGFVFQNPDHQVVMPTVAADVAFGLGRYALAEADVITAVTSALDLVNMSEYMYRATHTLSGGQRQRVAIAGALAEGPAVLLLDELTTFLDVEDQFGVLGAVKDITRSAQGVTAIWVTHRFEELSYADSATYMVNGRAAYTGSPEDVKAYMRKLGAPI